MRNKLNLFVFFSILLCASSVTLAKESTHKFSGNETSISSYAGKGKWLVVMIWASDCQVCNKEAHQYQAFHNQHKDKDAQVVGLSMDGKEKSKDAHDFLKRHNINFPNLLGEPMDIASMYQAQTGANWVGTPSFMVFNPRGELVGAQAGAVPVSIIESFIEREATSSGASKS